MFVFLFDTVWSFYESLDFADKLAILEKKFADTSIGISHFNFTFCLVIYRKRFDESSILCDLEPSTVRTTFFEIVYRKQFVREYQNSFAIRLALFNLPLVEMIFVCLDPLLKLPLKASHVISRGRLKL